MAEVLMADGSTYEVKTLLSDGDSNTKLRKSNSKSVEYLTVGLSLSPAKESGYEMCASRSPGCTQACLFTAGRGVYANVRNARIARTRLFHQDRALFRAMLFSELMRWEQKAHKQGKVLACRLNVVSDVMWEKMFPELFSTFANVQFYDYTKHFLRMLTYCGPGRGIPIPENYHLTFSRSENNDEDCKTILYHGGNVAIVFNKKELPETYWGYKVINGDETDLRFLDESGTIVGLYAKGRGKKDESGFVVQLGLINRS